MTIVGSMIPFYVNCKASRLLDKKKYEQLIPAKFCYSLQFAQLQIYNYFTFTEIKFEDLLPIFFLEVLEVFKNLKKFRYSTTFSHVSDMLNIL